MTVHEVIHEHKKAKKEMIRRSSSWRREEPDDKLMRKVSSRFSVAGESSLESKSSTKAEDIMRKVSTHFCVAGETPAAAPLKSKSSTNAEDKISVYSDPGHASKIVDAVDSKSSTNAEDEISVYSDPDLASKTDPGHVSKIVDAVDSTSSTNAEDEISVYSDPDLASKTDPASKTTVDAVTDSTPHETVDLPKITVGPTSLRTRPGPKSLRTRPGWASKSWKSIRMLTAMRRASKQSNKEAQGSSGVESTAIQILTGPKRVRHAVRRIRMARTFKTSKPAPSCSRPPVDIPADDSIEVVVDRSTQEKEKLRSKAERVLRQK